MRGRGLEQRVCDGTVDCPDFSGHHHQHHHHEDDNDHENDNDHDKDEYDADVNEYDLYCDNQQDDGNAYYDWDHEEDDDDTQSDLHYKPHICNCQMSCTVITAPKSTSIVGSVRYNC